MIIGRFELQRVLGEGAQARQKELALPETHPGRRHLHSRECLRPRVNVDL